MTRILILAAALLALLWWKRPRRREIDDWHRAHTYVEPEDGVQVDPRPADVISAAVWAALEVTPGFSERLDRGIAELDRGEGVPFALMREAKETVSDREWHRQMLGLGHDDLPHTPSNWTAGCRRCDMLQERLLRDIRVGKTSVPVR